MRTDRAHPTGKRRGKCELGFSCCILRKVMGPEHPAAGLQASPMPRCQLLGGALSPTRDTPTRSPEVWLSQRARRRTRAASEWRPGKLLSSPQSTGRPHCKPWSRPGHFTSDPAHLSLPVACEEEETDSEAEIAREESSEDSSPTWSKWSQCHKTCRNWCAHRKPGYFLQAPHLGALLPA